MFTLYNTQWASSIIVIYIYIQWLIKRFNKIESGESNKILRQVVVDRVNKEVCNSTDIYDGVINESMICAGFLQGGKDSCQVSRGYIKNKISYNWYHTFKIITCLVLIK